MQEPGVIDQDVGRAQFGLYLFRHRADFRAPRDIGLDRQGGHPKVAHRSCCCLRLRRAASVIHRHTGSASGQL